MHEVAALEIYHLLWGGYNLAFFTKLPLMRSSQLLLYAHCCFVLQAGFVLMALEPSAPWASMELLPLEVNTKLLM